MIFFENESFDSKLQKLITLNGKEDRLDDFAEVYAVVLCDVQNRRRNAQTLEEIQELKTKQ